MNASECALLIFFRRYEAGPRQMLFFNPNDCKLAPSTFNTAMQSLIHGGLVAKERPTHAYSLTQRGYARSLSIQQKAELQTMLQPRRAKTASTA